ncbi:DNA polymerase III subunit delta [Patescibacteria group bacterium]|nr:DNA polymerase III subunit delta [Patescibacteria group bacterium]
MIIFLYGADTFRAKEKLKELKIGFLEKNNGNQFLISTIDSTELDLADFRNKVLSSGFFADKKLVVLKNFSQNKNKEDDALLEIIKRIPEEITLIIWEQGEDAKFLKSELGKYLLNQKYVFKFTSLSGNALIGWIRERVGSYGCEIDNESALLICDILGDDLWKIDLELNKLCAFTIGYQVSNSKIGRKAVEKLLKKEAEENIFKFIDALAGKNKRLALLTLQNEFDAGASELGLLGMIARQIRILLQIKAMQNVGVQNSEPLQKAAVAKDLGVHPYVAQKSLAQARNFHTNELKNIYRQLLAIDMSIKSSAAPARVLFDRMISKL